MLQKRVKRWTRRGSFTRNLHDLALYRSERFVDHFFASSTNARIIFIPMFPTNMVKGSVQILMTMEKRCERKLMPCNAC